MYLYIIFQTEYYSISSTYLGKLRCACLGVKNSVEYLPVEIKADRKIGVMCR
jgi:hypothetical protein